MREKTEKKYQGRSNKPDGVAERLLVAARVAGHPGDGRVVGRRVDGDVVGRVRRRVLDDEQSGPDDGCYLVRHDALVVSVVLASQRRDRQVPAVDPRPVFRQLLAVLL